MAIRWKLYECIHSSAGYRPSADWRNFVVVIYGRPRVGKKKRFHLGWNGDRLAQHRDADDLEIDYPEIYREIQRKIREVNP